MIFKYPKIIKATFLYFFICLIYSCSDDSESINLKAIIRSESSIDLFESIVLDATDSEGDIQNYQWTLVNAPNLDIITIEEYEKYFIGQNSNNLRVVPPYVGTYEIELTITDSNNNNASSLHTFDVSGLCGKIFSTENLLIDNFDSGEEWEFFEGSDNILEDCSGINEHQYGNFDLGNGFMEIFSGTDKEFRLVKKSLSNINLFSNSTYRLTLNIGERMYKPYFHHFFFTNIYRTNFMLRYKNHEIRIKLNPEENDWWDENFIPIFENYYFENELIVYFKINENTPIIFACSNGENVTSDIEIVETSLPEDSISFVAHAEFAETDCWYPNRLKIAEFKIDKLF
ncbi:PKD domain-containing protein [Flagellimonas iocasae]|uniref:PKD domain-containing protein n=1 Tax=Flagellimonas iocasae TaxID=2055905 RepID=A0ABW4Y038_9FLAO